MIEVREVVLGVSITLACPDCEQKFGTPCEQTTGVIPTTPYSQAKWKRMERFGLLHERCGESEAYSHLFRSPQQEERKDR